jgi:hypothetical protein
VKTDSFRYIEHLQALTASRSGDQYVKKWARIWLDEIAYQERLILQVARNRETAKNSSYATVP